MSDARRSSGHGRPADPEVVYGELADFFGRLVDGGITDVVLSPGSRSTPLTLTADATPGLRTWIQLDERSAGFFAVGLAKATGRPAVLVCTSGTAAANYLPAVAEARYAAVPLLVCTADRPPELRGVGAGQTIDQVGLFGSHARWSVDAPVPGDGDRGELARLATAAIGQATTRPRGPVHVNLPLREPLEPPISGAGGRGEPASVSLPAESRRQEVTPPIDELVAAHERGLIVAGPDDVGTADRDAVLRLAAAAGWPVVADPASPMRRCSGEPGATVVTAGEAILRTGWADRHRAEVVVRVGLSPTSKAYRLWLERVGVDHLVLVDPDELANEPTGSTTAVIRTPPSAWAIPDRPPRSSDWLRSWQQAEATARGVLDRVAEEAPLDEPGAVAALSRDLPSDANLVVTNSMPIRDLDLFLGGGRPLRVWANRGANGIDGQTSTALGIAAATAQPTVLLTGDLALLHDLTGLLAARRLGIPLTVVLLDNDGGGIFSFLPIAERSDVDHDRLFRTPHGLDLDRIAPLAGFVGHTTTSADELGLLVARSMAEQQWTLVRVPVDHRVNLAQHRAALATVAEHLDGPG